MVDDSKVTQRTWRRARALAAPFVVTIGLSAGGVGCGSSDTTETVDTPGTDTSASTTAPSNAVPDPELIMNPPAPPDDEPVPDPEPIVNPPAPPDGEPVPDPEPIVNPPAPE